MSLGLGLDLTLRSGRSSGWSPMSLGVDLLDMWDVEDLSKLTLSGASVNAWASSKNSYSAAQAVSASKPTYSATSFNGRPGITFDGADDELTFAGVGVFPVGATACEVWALVDQVALPADTLKRTILCYGDDATAARNLERFVVTGVNRTRGIIGNGASGTGTGTPGIDFSGRHVVRMEVGAASTVVSADGSASTGTAVVPATTSVRTRIGAVSSAGAAAFFQGAMSLVAVTNPLNATQAGQMLAYLKARGGIA